MIVSTNRQYDNSIHIGELRNTIEIQEYKRVVNDYGGTEYEYNTVCTPRAKVKYISTNEYLNNNSESVSYSIKFIIRSRKNITNDNYVLFKNERYNIVHVYPFSNMKYMELTCERIK